MYVMREIICFRSRQSAVRGVEYSSSKKVVVRLNVEAEHELRARARMRYNSLTSSVICTSVSKAQRQFHPPFSTRKKHRLFHLG